jgi:hypothetical protein
MKVQGGVNLHKPRKSAINANWSQINAQTRHGQLDSQKHNLKLGRPNHFIFSNIFFD